jgi:histidinol-phosphate aminotransferase
MTASPKRFSVPPNILQIDPYIPGKPEEELIRELGLKRVIKMASNENCLGPSPLAVNAMKGSFERAHRYPDGSGYYVRKAISQKQHVGLENIILGNGSTDLVEILARTYLQPGENAITADQTFLMYRMAAVSVNACCKSVPLVNYTYDLPAFIRSIDQKTRLIFIANPNNPTGTMLTKRQIEEFLPQVPPEVIVVIDEAYSEYVDSPEYPNGIEYLDQYSNLIILRTFSKIYGLAGIRIGYGIACPEMIQDMNRIRSPFNTNALAQAGALAALGDFDHIARSRELNRKQREFLSNELKKMNVTLVPSVANFLLILVADSTQVYEGLLRRGVIVRPMNSFNCAEGLRVTVGTEEGNRVFLEALKTVLP